MIEAKVTTTDKTDALIRAARGGAWKALKRVAAYTRGVARNMVKRRKRKSSPPGHPPYAHNAVFKASILFETDLSNFTAYVGPRRLKMKRTNAFGQTIPNILEYGGPAARGGNSNWWQKGYYPSIKTEKDIADFALRRGYGPAFWGLTLAAIRRKMQEGGRGSIYQAHREKGGKGSNSQYQRFQRYSPIKGRRVYLSSIKISAKDERGKKAQAAKIARTVVEIFGFPNTTKSVRIAARPLMGPSLQQSRSFIFQTLQNSLNK